MKRWLACLLILVLCAGLAVSAGAAGRELVVDEAGLLTRSERDTLLMQAERISEQYQCAVAVVTVSSLGGKSAEEFADDFYDDWGYGYGPSRDGILLLISMEYRDWAMSTSGKAIGIFSDSKLNRIFRAFRSDLQDGRYAAAFGCYLNECDRILAGGQETGGLPLGVWGILICLALGFVFAAIPLALMKRKMKSVRSQPAAETYVRSGSLQLTEQSERFLYRNVQRIRRETSSHGSSVHTSSSGRSHGGASGKF